MRIFLGFLILFAYGNICDGAAYGAPRRVLPAAISQSANNTENTTISTRGNNVVKSRVASVPAPAVKSRNAVRNATPPLPRNSVAPAAPRAAVRSRAATANTTAPAALQSLVDARAANDECLDSYTKCMDNYCNVLDADLGRCSCGGDITQFAKISDALATANTELQDVMKKISYLGLSADEITSMYTQTAAEGVMGTITDTSKIKSDLNAITNMLVDVKTPSAGATGTSNDGISGLLNIDLTANNFDINSVLGTIGGTNSSPLLNQRGEQLYKSAAARCKSSVLKNCIGADENVVVSQYKTEINRACIAYGNTLQTKNDDARRMIDNAGRVLQMARLKVQSDKDAYDLKACVAALDTCMRDDFVCGDDYGHCLDASGRYFVNGELVSGATESKIMTDIWGAATPSSDGAFITQHATNTNIASLIQRVGNPITRDGLCSNVLNKCQKQWRDGKSNTYNSMNNVVLAWLGDVIPKIVVRQRTLINDFRTDCISTVNACMAKQGISNNIKPRSAQPIIGDFLAAQVGACRTTIDACAGVMGMEIKQILVPYIQKSICDGYSITLDICDVDSYCKNVESQCLVPKVTDYYGSYPFQVGVGTNIIKDLWNPFINTCATDSKITECATEKGLTSTQFLTEWINNNTRQNMCKSFNPEFAADNVCNTTINGNITKYTNDVGQQLWPQDEKLWYPFWLTDDAGHRYSVSISEERTENDASIKAIKGVFSRILGNGLSQKMIKSLVGYKGSFYPGFYFGYKTVCLRGKCSNADIVMPIDDSTIERGSYLPIFVQGSTNAKFKNDVQPRSSGCVCRLAMPFTTSSGPFCYTHPLFVGVAGITDDNIFVCPELCAYIIYGEGISMLNWNGNISANVIVNIDGQFVSGSRATSYINNFILSAFRGTCYTDIYM